MYEDVINAYSTRKIYKCDEKTYNCDEDVFK